MPTGWMTMGRLAPIAVLIAASPALAQSPPPGAIRGGAYAATVSDIDEAIVPPREAIRMLRSTGYTVLSRPRPAGLVLYSIAVITPRGDDGRIYMDIRDGRLVRFVPGYALTPRTDADIDLAYNPPSPPPAAPRKPAKPKAASLPPAATTGPARSMTKQAAPKLPEIKPAETKPAQTPPAPAPVAAAAPAPQTTGVATKPAEAKPPVVIQPTQEMPAVQGLE